MGDSYGYAGLPGPGSGASSLGGKLVQAGLLAEFRLDEQGGGSVHDAVTGSVALATFPGGGNNPTWTSTGLSFAGTVSSAQYLNVALNLLSQIRTVQICFGAANPSPVYPQTLLGSYDGTVAKGLGLRSGSLHPTWGGSLDTPDLAGAFPLRGDNCLARTYGFPNRLYVNGSEVPGYEAQPNGFTDVSASILFQLGAFPGTIWGFNGPIYHVAFWNRVLSADEIRYNFGVVGRMLALRGISLASGLRSTLPLVWIDGDSLTAGQNPTFSQQTPTYAFSQLSGTYNWLNMAHGDRKLTDMSAAATIKWPAVLSQFVGQPSVYVVMGGTADLWVEGVSGATAFNRLTNLCQLARGAGFKKILVYTLAAGDAFGTTRAALNTLIRNASAPPWDTVADLGADVQMGVEGTQINTTYFQADTVHFTDAGCQRIATQYLVPALQAFGIT